MTERDFVFYSIFEWQERKCPLELLEAYVRAFPTETDTLLLIKTNPGAVSVARQAVEKVRQQVRSEARIAMCCAAWSEAHIAALHERGDCYVSLHRGEGWGYPLFEAASRGTPVIATGYAGPLDYLQPRAHQLVRYELRPVRQPYVYYHPRMRWAEPDVSACGGTYALGVCQSRGSQRASRRSHAEPPARLRARGRRSAGPGAVVDSCGSAHSHTSGNAWRGAHAPTGSARSFLFQPSGMTQDYFEHGVKSNWDRGYTWPWFAGLFQETAAFLSSMFPRGHFVSGYRLCQRVSRAHAA